MKINSDELNKSILYYINEARTSPKDFSRHLMVDDDVDDKIYCTGRNTGVKRALRLRRYGTMSRQME